MELYEKYNLLKSNLQQLKSIIVAFSGGVDSTFLLKVAKDMLHDNVIAITAKSPTYPERELNFSIDFAKKINVYHEIIEIDELSIDGFSSNPVNRCYLCKKELFGKILSYKDNLQINHIIEGSNYDDQYDYRPGMNAIKELSILSPLKQAGLTKEDIRILSKEIGLETWDKPSFACLSSRIPYGESITKEKLEMIDSAEQFLLNLGFKQIRVRHHGTIARIEIGHGEIPLFFNTRVVESVNDKLKSLGFTYVTLDLNGYTTGSMNKQIATS